MAPGRKEFHELDGFLVKGVSPLGSSGGYGVRAGTLKNMPLKMSGENVSIITTVTNYIVYIF